MGLIAKLTEKMQHRNYPAASIQAYCHWNRKFYQFTGRPASQWTTDYFRQFISDLKRQSCPADQRAIAIKALKFTFKTLLKIRIEAPDLSTLIRNLDAAMIEHSFLPNTMACYRFWNRKFYGRIRKAANEWTGQDVRQFLLWMHDQNYSNVSRKQALNALAFTFKHVLKLDLGNLDLPPMPRVRQTNRIIPSREELGRLFTCLHGQVKLMAALLYGSGLRVACECCRLRVHDVDLQALTILVWQGKGAKCRKTLLPRMLVPMMQRHLAWRKALHDQDLAEGRGLVELPNRLAQKYRSASREFGWQWLFPSTIVRGQYRWHATEESIAKQMRRAITQTGITKRITPHTLRHAFATHGLQLNDIKTIQDLLGHEDLNTTALYLHADAARGVSPLDTGLPRPQTAPLIPSLPDPQLAYMTAE